jgi:hypothetical protein
MIDGTLFLTVQSVLPSMTSARFACERCRFHKLRCQRSGPESAGNPLEACVRCTRANAKCTTKTRGRLGRPRTEKKNSVREGQSERDLQRPDINRSGENQINPERTSCSISSRSMSPTSNFMALLSSAVQAEQSSTLFCVPGSPTVDLQSQNHFDTSADDLTFDTTGYDLHEQLGSESFLTDSTLDITLFSELAPEIPPTDKASTTASAHRSELELSPSTGAQLSSLGSPEKIHDPSLCLLDINKKLLEQYRRLKNVDDKCT